LKLFDRNDYRYSFYDGMCAHVHGMLTGGVFLTGFALYLGMSEFMLGVMMAIPFIVTFFQLPASYYICRNGRRKTIAFRAATLARLSWLPILGVGMIPLLENDIRCMAFLGLFMAAQVCSSISYIAWISWTSDLVPDDIRGRFFGTRNMLCGAAGIVAILIFGNLTDVLKAGWGPSVPVFVVPFGCAVAFGLMSSYYLRKIGDIDVQGHCAGGFVEELSVPFKDPNFRRFLLFALCWNFSVYLAAPFFSLYFLRELEYSYGFVALLSTVAAAVDLLAMKFWGALSDRIKNKAVIRVTGWGVVFLPALWVLVRPQDVLLPVVLQMVSGAFWSAMVLCSGNLLLGISPQKNRVWYISAYSIAAGLGSAAAPIVGGIFLSVMKDQIPAVGIMPLHLLFLSATALRMASLLWFRWIREPQEKTFRQSIRILWDAVPRPHTKSALAAVAGDTLGKHLLPARFIWGRQDIADQPPDRAKRL
jgi:MFS family permease